MKAFLQPAVTLAVLICLLLVFPSCGGQAPESTPTEPTAPTELTTPSEPTTPAEPELESISWLDVSQYTGIPSADCSEPITDLTGLPAASFKLTVDVTKKVGALDNARWANVGVGSLHCAVTYDHTPIWELNRQTGALKYMRIFSIFSDGLNRDLINTVNGLLLYGGRLPTSLEATAVSPGCDIYSEDADGNPVYTFWRLDCTMDTLLSAGVKPIVVVGFMPDALVEGEQVRNNTCGSVNTPNDYNKWRDLVYNTVKHCVERYGAEEVRTWYWELWNEPDIDSFFIDAAKFGTQDFNPQRYLKMYDFFAAGAKAADSQVRIGGPTLGLSHEWLQAFLSHCVSGANSATGGTGAPLDFIVWHGFDKINGLTEINQSTMNVVRQFPSLKGIPVVEDEWGQTLLVMDYQGHIVEDYIYAEQEYTNHEAALLCRFIDASLTDPENQPDLVARAGMVSSAGGTYRYFSIATARLFIPMPVLNTYLLLAKMGKEQLEMTGTSYGDAVHGFAAKTSDGIQVLLYHFNEADKQSEGAATEVDLTITGLPEGWSAMKRYLIDSQNSSAWANYPRGSSRAQMGQLEADSKLKIVEQTDNLETSEGQVTLRITMPANSVSLVVIGQEAAPAFTPSPHIARVIQEEAAYQAAKTKLENYDIAGAKADFEQLVADSFAAVTDTSSNNPYSLWGQKALFALLDITDKEGDSAAADEIRQQLLLTTLGDLDRFVLLYERLDYLNTLSAPGDEIQTVSAELQSVRSRLEYFANWSSWTIVHGYQD
jgi:xylan 1,4-beta-xylosidase